MRNIALILSIGLFAACASKNEKLLNQFEEKVEQYETLSDNKVPYNDPQLETVYNEITDIMDQLMANDLSDEESSRATGLSLRLQVAIMTIENENDPGLEIDLNSILQQIEAENADN